MRPSRRRLRRTDLVSSRSIPVAEARTSWRTKYALRSTSGPRSRASATSKSPSERAVAVQQSPRVPGFDLAHHVIRQALRVQFRELIRALAQRRIGAEQELRSIDEL